MSEPYDEWVELAGVGAAAHVSDDVDEEALARKVACGFCVSPPEPPDPEQRKARG